MPAPAAARRPPPALALAVVAAAFGTVLAVTVLAAPRSAAATPAPRPAVVAAIQGSAPAAAPPRTLAAAAPAQPVEPARPAAPALPGCGIFDVACQAGQAVGHAIDSWFASLVKSAVNPLFALLGQTLLSTPQIGGFSTVRGLWAGSLAIADAGYVLLVLAGGIVVMGHQTLQTSYAVKDIAPRLVVGFLAANLSLVFTGKAIELADGLSAALAGQGLNPAAAGAMLRSLIERVIGEGGMFFILLALFAVALLLVLAIIYVARLMLTVVLVAMAPLALACHALPQTEGIARWWWRAFAGILLIQSAQALVLVAAMRVFFTEQWAPLIVGRLGDAGTATFEGVQLLCLLYILVRIPFWIYRRVWSAGGRSPLRSAVRFVFAAAVLRRIAPALSGQARPPRSAAATGGRRPGGGGPRPAAGPRPLPPGGGQPAGPSGSASGPGHPGGTTPSGPSPGPPHSPGHRRGPHPGSGSGGTSSP
jgi:hypothetical protein